MWQVIGQTQATRLLDRSVKTGQLSHAYLFVGPPHVGKMTLALNLAQAVNCHDGQDAPCGECAACTRIARGKHADVQVVAPTSDGKRDTGIDQIRQLQESASLPPYEGKCKVFIFDRADTLSNEAANCLLKTLEEPSPRVLMVLLSAREKDLLPTIVSRCQRVELRPVPLCTVQEALAGRHTLAAGRSDLIARLAGGCLGWAFSAVDQGELIDTRNERLAELLDVLQARPGERLNYADALAAGFSKRRSDVEERLALWVEWWHDLLRIKAGHDELISNIDFQDTLWKQANHFNMRQVIDSIHHLQEAGQQLERNANPRLALEVLMLSMP